jgi:hypothetical protein
MTMPHYKAFFDKEYLGAWDLPRDITVQIEAVTKAKLEGTGQIKANSKPILAFRGTEKRLIVNATIGATIAGMYGPQTEDWVGKRVTLYATQCSSKGGQMVDCVRVRPAIPKGKAEALASQPVDTDMRAKQDAAFEREEAPPDGHA